MPTRLPPSPLLRIAIMFFVAICCRHAVAQTEDRLAIVKVPPTYPVLARQMHVSGKVKVTATVDASGKVTHAESDSQVMLLVPAAIEAVKAVEVQARRRRQHRHRLHQLQHRSVTT